MSGCSFSIEFSGSPDRIVGKAESAIRGAGGKFTGDVNGGSFNLSTGIGSVKGGYTISDDLLDIVISEKPAFISCSRIEKELRKYLGKG
jgi:hypothetical protein